MKHSLATITRVVAVVLAASALVGVGTHVVNAQQNNGQALEIAPPVVNLTADPGQTINTQISLRDISPTPLIVTSQINDFGAAGEDGTPKIQFEEAEPSPYSIREWIEPLAQLQLNPREIKNLPVIINVPDDAAPGGYFGVIRFTATPPDLDGTGVSLSASLGSLVFIRVNGQANEKLSFVENSISKNDKAGTFFESAPLLFTQRLKNDGNVFLQPAGLVTVKDMFGKTIATLGVNQPPRNILPGSVRKFSVPLDSSVIGNKQLFGKYTAETVIRYGIGNQTVTDTTTFWVIPYKLIGGAIILLVAAFFGLRFAIRRYNKRIIQKSQRRN